MLKSIAGAVIGEVIGRKRGHGLLGAGIGLVAGRRRNCCQKHI
jgi:hypothetical protein